MVVGLGGGGDEEVGELGTGTVVEGRDVVGDDRLLLA
jgi:hypothetical protein